MVVTALIVYLLTRPHPTRARVEILPPPSTTITTPIRTANKARTPSTPPKADLRELPPDQRDCITGEGSLDSARYFNCTITNRSAWFVTELQFEIAAGQNEGSTRWERSYREYVQLPPGASRHISFKVTDGENVETRWSLKGARGAPVP